MILYHGSNVKVEKSEIIVLRNKIDFGAGFYTTSDLEQAQKWSKRKTKLSNLGTSTVNIFEFTDSDFEKLKILNFPTANAQWLNFVCDNRKAKIIQDEYDLIIGL